MVSRDTAVHVSAVLVGAATLLLAQLLFEFGESPQLSVAAALLWNGLVLAGAQLYLAVRGEDGMVSVEARWRYVAVVAVVLGAGALAVYRQGTRAGRARDCRWRRGARRSRRLRRHGSQERVRVVATGLSLDS